MQPVLGVYGIHYRWTRHGKEGIREMTLEEVTFEVERGEILAVLGPNGSGKSTLLKIIAGLLNLHRFGGSGQVKYRGQDFLSIPLNRRAQMIAYVGSDLKPEFPLTAEETVYLGRSCQSQGFFYRPTQEDRNTIQWAMEKCLCWEFRERLLDTLSGGERQLVALAAALAQSARILLLDETFSKMDLHHQGKMGRLMKELASEGYTFLLVAHDLNFASEWANRAILLKSGKLIAAGAITEMVTEERLGILYPGAGLVIGKNPATGTPKVFFNVSPCLYDSKFSQDC